MTLDTQARALLAAAIGIPVSEISDDPGLMVTPHQALAAVSAALSRSPLSREEGALIERLDFLARTFEQTDNPAFVEICRDAIAALSHPSQPASDADRLAARPSQSREDMRRLVDIVWQAANEDQSVPDTAWADRMIDEALADKKGAEG